MAMRNAITSVKSVLILLAVACSGTSHANDSSAAVGTGGIVLQQNEDVSMDSEDLFISEEKVRVTYSYTNRSAKDVSLLVSFPLPPIPDGIDYLGDQSMPEWKDFKFQTMVNGKPVTLELVERYEVNGRAVEARLTELGFPLKYWEENGGIYNTAPEGLETQIKNMPDVQRTALLEEGILRKSPHATHELLPNWNLVTHYTRTQTFPAGKSVTVEHSYVPVAGGSIGGGIESTEAETMQYYADTYCVDKNFRAGFAKKEAAAPVGEDGERQFYYVEHWLSYILSSGANWKGPIGDFRLVIDKGKPGNLLSFCMDGVKKISPTQFEVRKKNFEPKADLNIVIVEQHKP